MKIKLKPRFFIFLLIVGYALFALYHTVTTRSAQNSAVELKTPDGEKAQTIENVSASSEEGSGGDPLAQLKNTYKDKLTIIFFYDGFKNQETALNYIEVLKETLAILEPFKSLSDRVLYKTFTTDSQKCDVKNNRLICDAQLIESFKSLGADHFKVVIISPLGFSSSAQSARGSNSWITLSTFKADLPEEEFNRFLGAQFAQNLGRALGLSLESASETNDPNQYSKRPNCAVSQEEAESWWRQYSLQFDTVGYYQGCGGSGTSFYPEQGTIMSDNPQKESYGYVSEDYLRGALQCFYGNKNSITYPAGRSIVNLDSARNCEVFRNLYPEFWNE